MVVAFGREDWRARSNPRTGVVGPGDTAGHVHRRSCGPAQRKPEGAPCVQLTPASANGGPRCPAGGDGGRCAKRRVPGGETREDGGNLIGQRLGGRVLAAAQPVRAPEIGVTEPAGGGGAVLLPARPEVAPAEAQEDGGGAGVGALALKRGQDFFDGVAHDVCSSHAAILDRLSAFLLCGAWEAQEGLQPPPLQTGMEAVPLSPARS